MRELDLEKIGKWLGKLQQATASYIPGKKSETIMPFEFFGHRMVVTYCDNFRARGYLRNFVSAVAQQLAVGVASPILSQLCHCRLSLRDHFTQRRAVAEKHLIENLTNT